VYWQVGPDVRAGQVVRGRTLWAVRVANGAVQGPPVKIRQFDDQTIVLGLSPTGSLHYRVSANAGDLYTASMDPSTGKVTTVPAVLPTPNPGGPAAWSPDSRRIALMTGANPQKELHVFSLDDGKDQRVPTSVPFVNGLCWPSGDSILTNTITVPGGVGPSGTQATRIDAVRVDVATGDTRPAFPGAPSFRLWGCTDTTAASNDPIAVKVRNLRTGTETELYRLKRPAADHGMSKISPDGRLVAFLESLDADTSALTAIPSTGGPARELARAKAPAKLQAINGHAWSHDSRFVYFLKRADSKGPYDLYRVPATGGTEERMGLQAPELRALEIAPDGRTVFFAMGTFNRPEIWAMENFLPAD